jgi:predicted DsbA family dithiol-disulfide isomerase
MRSADQAARAAGVSGVPSFFLDGYSLFSGAMPADTIANALRRGHEILRKQQAAG